MNRWQVYLFLIWMLPTVLCAQQPQVIEGLSLGAYLPGNTVQVSYDNADAAAFFITGGTSNSDVEVSFTLPQDMVSGDGTNIPIEFGPDAAAYNTAENTTDAISFDPTVTQTLTLNGDGELYIWLGAMVDIPESQTSGDYTSDITLKVNPI